MSETAATFKPFNRPQMAKLVADDIPIQSRMMTVSDIYDALTANDRPYKRSIGRDRAIDILRMEVR